MLLARLLLPLAVIAVFLSGCVANSAGFGLPLPDSEDRPKLLTFGLYVTPNPAQNPIDPPERFTGFHTGTDFEIFENEKERDVDVFAICSGGVLFSGFAEGYGGALIQSCSLGGQKITVLYGHLAIDGLPEKATRLRKGESFAVLAPARSHDSGENRKHLHLTIHEGEDVEFLGYVQTPEELLRYIDPETVLPM